MVENPLPGIHGNAWRRTMLAFTTIAAIVSGLTFTGTASAAPPSTRCAQTVVLVHDIARGPDSVRPLKHALEQDGWCPHTVEYGATMVTRELAPHFPQIVAGLASLAVGAEEFGAALDDVPGEGPITVIGHGAGSLVAQYYLQHQHDIPAAGRSRSITKVITIGPIWRGTDAFFLGTTEELSRRLGTYDAVLQLERPIVDPICEGCRDLVAGSDFLRALHSGEFPTPGVDYRNIISPTDSLVEPALSAAIPGMDNLVLPDNGFGTTPDHFSMIADARVLDRVLADLATT